MVWWFSVPKVAFGEDALVELEKIKGEKAFIITDDVVNGLGFPQKISRMFTEKMWEVALWDKAQPDPPISSVKDAAEAMSSFGADIIVAVGGGSVIDTAKAAWILYENPEVKLEEVNPFMELGLRKKAKLVCIPTTAGTGSEATKDIVIREDDTGRKFGTINPELVPDIAILDPEFVLGLPTHLTAYTGMDALTHAVESYISGWKNPFSDACALQAVRMVFEWLPKSVKNLDDLEAREKMLVAANLGGIAFSNSQVCLAHVLGHSLGSVLRMQHGLAVGMSLPYTIEYNIKDDLETAKLYAELASLIGIEESDENKAALAFAKKIRELQSQIYVPLNLKDAGISREDFDLGLKKLVKFAMMDTSITMNPRNMDSQILRKIYEYMYEGKSIDF
jgi:alcohol dehydrogenase class IV